MSDGRLDVQRAGPILSRVTADEESVRDDSSPRGLIDETLGL